jgi:hypothetical protein
MSHDGHIHYVPESPAVDTRGVLWCACGALLLLSVAIAGLDAIYRHVVPVKTVPAPQAFPQPRVDARDAEELRRLRAAQSKDLETWRWANDQHTLVQIPIERAMQLLAQKGAAGYDPLLPPQETRP